MSKIIKIQLQNQQYINIYNKIQQQQQTNNQMQHQGQSKLKSLFSNKNKSKEYDGYGNIQEQNMADGVQFSVQMQGSQKGSQIYSINQYVRQECNPMILSNTQNIKSNLDKMLMLRMRNVVSQLKQKYIDIVQYIEDQRIIINQYIKDIVINIHQQYLKIYHQNKNNIIISNNKVQEEENMNNYERQQTYNNNGLKYGNQQTIKLLELKIKSINHNYQKLVCQNQSLQEYIFDIQQKIVGIDLQIQKRVKEKSKEIASQYKISASQSPKKQQDNEVIIQLNQQIQFLQKKCRHFEDLSKKQRELKELQLNLSDKRLLIQRQRDELQDLRKKIQKLKDANYQREHQILIAQQNLSKKIFEVKKKQTELSLWESQLTKKASQTQKMQNQKIIGQHNGENVKYHTQNYQNSNFQLAKESDEISLRSFGKSNHHNGIPNEFISPKTQQNLVYGSAYNNQPFCPQQYSHLPSNHRTREIVKEIKDYNINRSQHGRGFAYGQPSVISNSQAYGTKFMQRDREFSSPYHHIKDTVGALNKSKASYANNNIPTKTNYHHNNILQQSKHSRSSAVKSIKGVYQTPKNSLPKGGGQTKLTGLGSKLQRLRQQIKRQIDSMN